MFSFARSSSPGRDVAGADVDELARRPRRGTRARFSSRVPDVEPDLAGVLVLAPEGVDRVRHPALLADLLEQPRGRRAAEDRVEQRGRVAAVVVVRDPRPDEADVVLLGRPCAGSAARARAVGRRAAGPGRPRSASPSRRAARPPPGGRARRCPAAARTTFSADVRRAVVVRRASAGDRADHLGAADHRPAERVRPEHRFRGEVVDELLRVVVDHRDLLEHDLALGVEVRERRREDHVRHHVERLLEVIVGDPRVEQRRLARRRGVQLTAHLIEELRDLLIACSATEPRKSRCSMKCETPALPVGSSRDPAPTQSPSATERTLSMCSLITRSPPGSVVRS